LCNGLRADVGQHQIGRRRRHCVHTTDETFARDLHRDGIGIARHHPARAKEAGGARQDSLPRADIEHAHAGLQVVFHRLDAQPRGLMDTGAECHPRVHHDAEAVLGRRVVAPLGHKEESTPHLHRLQHVARLGHPVALILDALARAGVHSQQRTPVGVVLEEGADGLRVQLDDARRALLPKFGDQQVAVRGVAIDFKREHSGYSASAP
jgi:hypothetical protein